VYCIGRVNSKEFGCTGCCSMGDQICVYDVSRVDKERRASGSGMRDALGEEDLQ
jgi:hypothetical protein